MLSETGIHRYFKKILHPVRNDAPLEFLTGFIKKREIHLAFGVSRVSRLFLRDSSQDFVSQARVLKGSLNCPSCSLRSWEDRDSSLYEPSQ